MIEVLSHLSQRPIRRRPPWRKRFARGTLRAVPLLVWLGAIGAAWWIHQEVGSAGHVTGYAEDTQISLAHLEPGTVRSVHVALYETVAPGQLLVALDDTLERAELATVEEDISRLRAELHAQRAQMQLEHTLAAADTDDLLRRAELDRDVAHVDYLSQMSAFARDRILLRGARVERDIVRDLHAVDNAAFRELNELDTQVTALETAQQQNASVLERLRQAYQEADRRCAVARNHALPSFDEDTALTPYRIAIQVRQRELQEIVARIDAHVLRAPRAGQVVALAAAPGDRVLAGTPLVQIAAPSTQRVVAYLPETMIHFVRPGTRVAVTPAAGGAPLPVLQGAVVDLSAAVTEAPQRFWQMPNDPVWGRGLVIALNDQNAALMPGEAVNVRFLD